MQRPLGVESERRARLRLAQPSRASALPVRFEGEATASGTSVPSSAGNGSVMGAFLHRLQVQDAKLATNRGACQPSREQCLAHAIKMYLTPTENMMADIFTKPVDKTTFLRCRDYMMG